MAEEKVAHEHTHTQKKESNRWMVVTIALLAVLAISIIGNFYFMHKVSNYVGPPKGNYSGGTNFVGKSDAPVTLTMYTDFQCPYCARWYTDTFPQIKANYIDTGFVKLVVKDFPLSFHSNSRIAANAAECAKEQGHLMDYEGYLYDNQGALDRTSLIGYAKSVGADTTQFAACLDAEKYQSNIEADIAEGTAVGVSGTPGFAINGVNFPVGASPYSTFSAALDKALGK